MPRSLSASRMEAFSDGVFSIAATLLVLDLALHPPGTPLEQLLHAWPAYLGYVISFLTIGAAWLAHDGITDRLTRADSLLLRINLLLLLVVAFLPFPTRLVAEALHDTNSERVYVTLYGLTLLTIRLLVFALDAYARHEHLYSQGPADEELQTERGSSGRSSPGTCSRILIGLAAPKVAVVLYFALAVYPRRTVPRRPTAPVQALITDAMTGRALVWLRRRSRGRAHPQVAVHLRRHHPRGHRRRLRRPDRRRRRPRRLQPHARGLDPGPGRTDERNDITERTRGTDMADAETEHKELKNTGYEIFVGILSILSIVNIVLLYAVDDPNLSTVLRVMNGAPQRDLPGRLHLPTVHGRVEVPLLLPPVRLGRPARQPARSNRPRSCVSSASCASSGSCAPTASRTSPAA